MRAGVFRGAGELRVEEVPEPVVGPKDVLLGVHACGVCGSDLHAFRFGGSVAPGQIMGHEFAGEVLEVGAGVAGIEVGDRLTGLPIQPCGWCVRCLEGSNHLCQVWTTRSIAFGLPGAFAERLRIPDAVLGGNVHRLPDRLTLSDAALVEPLAVAVHAVRRAAPQPGQVAVVLGLGAIGLHAGQALLAAGAEPVIGVDLSPRRRAVAETLGMSTVDGSADSEALRAALRHRLGLDEVDIAVEASGAPSLVGRACEIVRPRGTIVLVALYHQPTEFDSMAAVQRELTVRGSANVTPSDFREALGLLAAGRARAEPLISHRFPLAEIDTAFRVQLDPLNSVKVLVTR
ncbi:MAG: alcohol dehydrogenase catalytic domain-containing protein [Pseudonocardia sp.]|nr:alcohol dehydrogenase catalytic domain-containing protein [Pseudonocardia sp.]